MIVTLILCAHSKTQMKGHAINAIPICAADVVAINSPTSIVYLFALPVVEPPST